MLLNACNSKNKDDDDIINDPTKKDMLSNDWDYGGHILNLGLGNLTGAAFTMTLTDPGNDTCTCSPSINGNQSSGIIQLSGCVASPANSCFPWTYNGSTTYTTKDGVLKICRGGGGGCTVDTFQ